MMADTSYDGRDTLLDMHGRVGVSPGTMALLISGGSPRRADLGRHWLDPGSGPFPPCPPNPTFEWITDPFKPASTTPPSYPGIGPVTASSAPPEAGPRAVQVMIPYASEGQMKGIALSGASPFGVKWSTAAFIFGLALFGGAGLAFATSRR